jgi:hypothetical protein
MNTGRLRKHQQNQHFLTAFVMVTTITRQCIRGALALFVYSLEPNRPTLNQS